MKGSFEWIAEGDHWLDAQTREKAIHLLKKSNLAFSVEVAMKKLKESLNFSPRLKRSSLSIKYILF